VRLQGRQHAVVHGKAAESAQSLNRLLGRPLAELLQGLETHGVMGIENRPQRRGQRERRVPATELSAPIASTISSTRDTRRSFQLMKVRRMALMAVSAAEALTFSLTTP